MASGKRSHTSCTGPMISLPGESAAGGGGDPGLLSDADAALPLRGYVQCG